MRRVRRTVGAQEELRVAAGGRLHQGHAVLLALEDGQAVVMRPDPAHEDGVAVVEQVLRRDGGAHKAVGFSDVLRGFLGGDVLEDDLQLGKVACAKGSACRR